MCVIMFLFMLCSSIVCLLDVSYIVLHVCVRLSYVMCCCVLLWSVFGRAVLCIVAPCRVLWGGVVKCCPVHSIVLRAALRVG